MNPDILQRRLQAGILCGGQGTLIETVHHIAAELDGRVPNTLIFKPDGQPRQLLGTRHLYRSEEPNAATRLPAGHPEGENADRFSRIGQMTAQMVSRCPGNWEMTFFLARFPVQGAEA